MSDSDIDEIALVTPWDQKGGIATYSDRLATTLREINISVTPVPISSPETWNPFKFNRILDQIPESADVVHVQFEAGVFGRFVVSGVCAPPFFHALERRPEPVVTTLHEVHGKHSHLHIPLNWAVSCRDFVVERSALVASDMVVVHTKEAKQIIQERHGHITPVERLRHPVEVNTNPVPTDVAKTELGLKGPTVLTFGWVESKKRYDDVIRVLQQFPDVTYVIAGEPRHEEDEKFLKEMLTLAETLGVREQVRYLGFIPDNEIDTVFCAADAVVLPYNRVAQSGVINLALGYRRPTVATSLPPFEALRSEYDCLLTYENNQDLVDRLKRALFDDAERERLVTQADTYAATETWENFAMETASIYRRINDSGQ